MTTGLAAAVEALHPPHTEQSGKVACPTCLVDYPCPTVLAIRADPVTGWQRPEVEPDQDLINAATVIRRIAIRPNRHPNTAAILLPIAENLRRQALDTRIQEPPC